MRARVLLVISVLTDKLSNASPRPPAAGEPEARIGELLARACEEVGISPRDYSDAVRADPELREIQNRAIEQIVLGTADPGPNDAISRESASGTPENRHLSPDWAAGGTKPVTRARRASRR